MRQVKEKTYGSTSTTDGYGHHDEDQGQMGALSALMAMGLFEVTGGGLSRPVYDITSPIFDADPDRLNRTTTREDVHDPHHHNSARDLYIQRARLDGRRWTTRGSTTTSCGGGTLELWLGDRPNTRWGVERAAALGSFRGGEPVYATGLEIDGPT